MRRQILPSRLDREVRAVSAATATRCWRSWTSWTSCWRRPAPAAAKNRSPAITSAASCWCASGSSCWSIAIRRFSSCRPSPRPAPNMRSARRRPRASASSRASNATSAATIPRSAAARSIRTRCAKSMRGFDICLQNRLPHILLTESGGADLPRQSEIFLPGGASFRDLTQLSAAGHSHDLAGVRQLDGRRRLHAGHVRLHRVRQRAGQGVSGRAAAGEDGHRRRIERRRAGRRRNALPSLGPVRLPGRRRARRAADRPRDRRQPELEEARARRRPTTSKSRSTTPKICWAWRRPI